MRVLKLFSKVKMAVLMTESVFLEKDVIFDEFSPCSLTKVYEMKLGSSTS